MALTTLGAIVARFDASGAAATFSGSGGLWVDEVPENKELPIAALIWESETPDWTFESSYVEEVRFHFELFAEGLAAVEAAATLVKAAFDYPGENAHTVFAVDNARVLGCQRQNYTVSFVGERSPDADKVYLAKIDYLIRVRKTLAT